MNDLWNVPLDFFRSVGHAPISEEDVVWGEDIQQQTTRREIREAVDSSSFVSPQEWGFLEQQIPPGEFYKRADEIARIAYLVVNKRTNPILLMVTPELRFQGLADGNHRLAAAFYRGDTSILAQVENDVDIGPLIGLDKKVLK